MQQTFIDAMRVWKLKGVPDNPSAWLFRVARNKAIDVIRRSKHSVQFDFSDGERALLKSEYTLSATMISEGNNYMDRAAFGDTVSSYHLEAAIAFEHCVAEKFEMTNWKRILELYDWLCNIHPSDITEINRAVVVLKLKGATAALAALKKLKNKNQAENYYLYQSLLGEIYVAQNDRVKARAHFEKAMRQTHSDKEKRLLKEKIERLLTF